MNRVEFKEKLSKIKSVKSKTGGASYHSIKVNGNVIEFVREGNIKIEKIYIDELLDFYLNGNDITKTGEAKKYIGGRVQSPAVALLIEFSKIEQSNKETSTPRNTSNNEPLILNKTRTSKTQLKDEDSFFIALAEVVGEDYLYSKSIGKPINSDLVFLSKNYIDFEFEESVNNCYSEILKRLNSQNKFSTSSIAHNIDGLIYNHPKIGSRIVEFDEEQHFTPARKESILCLLRIIENEYLTEQLGLCNNLTYFQDYVLKKHRISAKVEELPETFNDFIIWLIDVNAKESGYIKRKENFNFIGGRIAQRAYYDTLRDTAHLSSKNKLDSPIRFSKKEVENFFEMDFKGITKKKLKEFITKELKEKYNLCLTSGLAQGGV
ncbi:hypothetical protein [Proteiniphilum sp. UBA5384]|uniref:hypothetical protein n=1 Tax=Proteiniphilum sp. UBA5384 TaxID=1947279 RepID=UPI0025E16B41|nr:hypothetical protein [Proteiniphilum sp. UBA5384]